MPIAIASFQIIKSDLWISLFPIHCNVQHGPANTGEGREREAVNEERMARHGNSMRRIGQESVFQGGDWLRSWAWWGGWAGGGGEDEEGLAKGREAARLMCRCLGMGDGCCSGQCRTAEGKVWRARGWQEGRGPVMVGWCLLAWREAQASAGSVLRPREALACCLSSGVCVFLSCFLLARGAHHCFLPPAKRHHQPSSDQPL